MNGVDPPNHNRFRELDPSYGKPKPSKIKRLRADDFLPLPTVIPNDDHIPRYLVASALAQSENSETKPLASYNVFQIEKGLNIISRDYLDVTEMRSGDLMIKTADMKSAKKFLKAKYIDIVPVTITMHKGLNSTQGRIFSRKIIELSEEELLMSLADQKVIEIRKLSKREGEKYISTGAAVVTFDLIRRPDSLKLGWERVTVDEYVSNPMRCANCQKLGHTKKRCRNIELCRVCGFTPPHEQCTRKFCVNCNNENHTSFDSSCPSFLKHKSVNKIKADKRCTVREAWSIFNSNPTIHTIQPYIKKKSTYAEMLSNKAVDNRNNNNVTSTNNNQAVTTTINADSLHPNNNTFETNLNKTNNTQLSKSISNDNINISINKNKNKILNTNNKNTTDNNNYKNSTSNKNTITNMITDDFELTSEDQNRSWQFLSTSEKVGEMSMSENENAVASNEISYALTSSDSSDESQLKTPPKNVSRVGDLKTNRFSEEVTDLNDILTPETYKRTLPQNKKKAIDKSN